MVSEPDRVIPAQAGIQKAAAMRLRRFWMPAFAGMTTITAISRGVQ